MDLAAGGSLRHASLGIRLSGLVGLNLVIDLLANIVSIDESISSSSTGSGGSLQCSTSYSHTLLTTLEG